VRGARSLARLEPWVCNLQICSRVGRGGGRAVLIAIAFAAMLIATLVWLSSRFNMDELYGILD
jgi:hypothetical protein